jgi:hypothetical protein
MTLRSFYRIVVVGTLVLYAMMAAFVVIAALCRYDTAKAVETCPNFIFVPLVLIIDCFVIGMGVHWLGMIWDCAISSKMPIWLKVLWLALIIPTYSVGAFIYYFRVYKNRQVGAPDLGH